MMLTQQALQQILANFQLGGHSWQAGPFGKGHIHQSFRVRNGQPGQPDYLLQRINSRVFPDVPALMKNIQKVTAHLGVRASQDGQRALQLIPSQSDEFYHRDGGGDYWRMYLFEKELHSIEVPQGVEQIRAAGFAFGFFLKQLSDFPSQDLVITIPHFHSLPKRLHSFGQSVESDLRGRRMAVAKLIQRAYRPAEQLLAIDRLASSGRLPLRITHNDTKINNLLFDAQGVGRCVVDLDTVMPGLVHYDFGDGVRTTVSEAAEDEPDWQKVEADPERLAAFASGYLPACRDGLRPAELESLPLAPAYMAYLMAIRFLTDYLEGDVYYQIARPAHNLDRARAQLVLCEKLLQLVPRLDILIKKMTERK